MKIIKKIGLSKLFLWQEAERIQTWPEAFASLEPGQSYTRRDLAEKIFGLVYKSSEISEPIRKDVMNNCFGFSPVSHEKIVIHGINAFKETGSDRFKPAQEALDIGKSFAKGNEELWTIPLASLIAKFEVRTRLMLYLLGKGGWKIAFENPEFFAYPSVRARLICEDEVIEPFKLGGKGFNRLLHQYRHAALGSFWSRKLINAGYEIADDFVFEAVRQGQPSTNKLNSSIKGSLFLMKYLGILETNGHEWKLCNQKALQILGKTIAEEFLDISEEPLVQDTPLLILKKLTAQSQDSEGFVIVSRLAGSWAAQTGIGSHNAAESFDHFIREQIYKDVIRITSRHQGQPRHGRGLFGDDNARKLKIEFPEA
ncbi:Uncharacterized protein dnl_06400 [Desulfonema limicola]|uniref:Uncharacterized protein n=1 Tax=Desulfonema limicola TaxID=45656 RepID=A0A975GES4_9BACT|nr:hypothetical protein [Desulfonema limicola]QTA78419.1 Uncharacterized protein dnl_06400 [Desulfonema limicola]